MAETTLHPEPCALPDAVRRRLERETIVWLGTTRGDGAPHIIPLWFTFDGESITVFSKPNAVKVRNVRRDPRVSIAVGAPGVEFEVTLLEGRASLADSPAHVGADRRGLERYGEAMDRLGVSIDEFLATYSQAIRVVPSRVLDWGQPGWLPTQPVESDSGELFSRGT